MKSYILAIGMLVSIFLMQACSNSNSQNNGEIASTSLREIPEQTQWTVPIKQLSPSEYPDNPDWEMRHSQYDAIAYKEIVIDKIDAKTYRFKAIPANDKTDTLQIKQVSIMEYIPMVPTHVRGDEYLTYIGIINQEWNRLQVRFAEEDFQMRGNKNRFAIKKVDLARNCLNAYLWELIFYAEDSDKGTKPFYHGWFNFPKDLYAQLFELRNPGLKYESFRKPLENWVEPPYKKVNLEVLRTVLEEKELKWESYNDGFYALTGERQRKQKNIIFPKDAKKIQDFLTDKSLFATFSPPGFYNTKDPRKTELSRFAEPVKVIKRKVQSKNKTATISWELEYQFKRSTDKSLMRLVIGGVLPKNLEKRTLNEVHRGWQMPMGIALHSFYEYYPEFLANPSEENPYYAFLLDEKGTWLDSHKVGIDGPLLHLDRDKANWLHLWILSFERHAFVGHIGCYLGAEPLNEAQ